MIFFKASPQNPCKTTHHHQLLSNIQGFWEGVWKKITNYKNYKQNIKKSSRQHFGNYIKSTSEKTACRYRKRRGLTICLKRFQFSSVMLLGGDKYHTFWLKYWSESLDLLQNHENIGYFDWTQLCNHLPDANVLTQVFYQFREINTVG